MAEIDATPVDVPVVEPVVEAPAETSAEGAVADAGAKRKLEEAPVDTDAEEHVTKRAREGEANGVEVRATKIGHNSPRAFRFSSSETL